MSLFGAAAKPSGAGGLFGSVGATPGAGGGLFGASTTTQQTPAATGTSLFGQQAQQTPAAGGSSLFGQPAQQQQQQTPAVGGSSLFGQPAQQQQPAQQTGGLFGASTATQQQQQQQQPQIQAATINYDNLRPRTRFDDLAQPVQDQIALLDKGISRVIKMRDEINSFMPQHSSDIEQLARDVSFVESKFRTVQIALNRDIQTVKALQDMTKKNIGDAQLSFKATDNLKLPTHYHQTGLFASNSSSANKPSADAGATHGDAQDLITYFNRICDDVERRKRKLDEYRGAIERDMPGVENGLYEQVRLVRDRLSSGDAVGDQLGEVLSAIRETGTAIVSQAGQIADTRERLSRLQAGFVESGVYAA